MIKEHLLKIYVWFLNFIKPLKWFMEYKKEKNKIVYKPSILSDFKGKSLILLPHVDDEWMGCSQLLLQQDAEVLLLDMDMPGGDTDSVHNQRKEELIFVEKTTNKPVQKIGSNKVDSLRSIIKEWEPNYIFLPFFIDWHDEHIQVMRYLRSTLENNAYLNQPLKVVGYQVSAPIPGQFITHALPMSKTEWEKKWQLFKSLYPSQKHIPYKRFALQECVNGAYVKSFAAEVFTVNTVTEWLDLFNKLLLTTQEKIDLKNNLSSISRVRNIINSILCRKNMII